MRWARGVRLDKGCGVVGGGTNAADRFGRNEAEGTLADVINVEMLVE